MSAAITERAAGVERAARSARRHEMTAAAARLFSERGYHGTSMQQLADALGLLKGSLYAHVGSKQELLFDVVDEGAERFLARGRDALDMTGTAAGRLEAFMVGHVETAIEHLDAATVFLNEWRYLSEELRSIVRAKRHRYEGMVRSIIAGGVATREFRSDADIDMTARFVLSAGNWVYTWYRPGGSLTPRDIGRTYTHMLVAGLTARQREVTP